MVGEHDRLQAAPLIEAVFELRADTSGSFALLPGKMAAGLEADYPDFKETEFAKLAPMVQLPPEAGFFATHQFRTSDGKSMVQLGPLGLTVNALAYPGFGAFRKEVVTALANYCRHASITAVRRLGLRYINGLPAGKQLLSGLTASVQWPALDGATVKSVAARGIFAYAQPQGELAVAIGAPSNIGPGTLLDLDFSYAPGIPMGESDILGWVDAAHRRVNQAFRAMTDPTLFESWR